MMGQRPAARLSTGIGASLRAAVLAIASVATLGASGCMQQHPQAVRSDSRASAELSGDAPTSCIGAEHEERVLDIAASSGHLAPQQIRDVMRSQQAAVSDCFETSHARRAAFKGTVTLLFAIEPDGSVSATSVLQSDLADCEVTQCLRTHLARLSFPAPEGGAVMVQYPIRVESRPLSAPVTASRR